MKFYYFSSTHWDREWYEPFQIFRKHLTDTADRLLEIFRTEPEIEKFVFDGQTIVLKDIVELRPSLEAELKQRIAEGKLKVGPWYVMPDEFLVSPEAMIRNLMIGRAISKEFGAEPWPVCYICDIFGHIAQMPQIVAGFGLQGAVIWRGFPKDCGPKVFWKGPDGTVIPVIRLIPRNGYGNFTMEVRGWWDLPLDEAGFKKRFTEWVEKSRAHFGDTFILSDALDHCQASKHVPQLLKWVRECYPDAELVTHTDYTDFFRNEFRDKASLPVMNGEQILPATDFETNAGFQISATLSSRYDIKLANDQSQQLLELSIEPQSAIRAANGSLKSMEMLHYAWKHLVQNHAHDTICGCSIDEVHRQALVRFEEVQNLGSALDEEFRIADRTALTGSDLYTETSNLTGDECWKQDCADDGIYRIRLFRSLPWSGEETRQFEIAFPSGVNYPKRQSEYFGYEYINSFRIYAEDGTELPYRIVRIRRNQCKHFHRHDNRGYNFYMVVCKPLLRGCGWTTLEIRPSKDTVRHRQTMLCGRTSASNGILRMDIASDGTYSVTDLRSGRCYPRQNEFHFDRDIGDGWNHVTPVGVSQVVSGTCTAVRVTQDGPVRVEFEIDRTYEIPEEMIYSGNGGEAYNGMFESKRMAQLLFRTFVAMDAGSDELKVRTEMVNTARDFRLRMEVCSGIPGDYFVSQSGTFLTRKPGREHGSWSDGFLETEDIGKNFDGIIGKRDAKGGIAVLTRAGLHEAGALPGDEGVFFVTLLRAFRRTVQTNDQFDGEMSGLRVWEYALKFFDGKTGNNDLYRALQDFRMPLTYHILPASRVKNTPVAESFMTLEGKLNLSCFKPAEDETPGTVIIRLMNLTEEVQTGTLRFAKKPTRAAICRIDETEQKEIAAGSEIQVKASPSEWVTLKLTF